MRKRIYLLCCHFFLILLVLFFSNYSNKSVFSLSQKIVFEGINIKTEDITNFENIVLNQYPSILIQLKDGFESNKNNYLNNKYTVEQAKEALRNLRDSNRNHFLNKNEYILQELELQDFDQTFSIDEYAPYIYSDFNRSLTEDDLIFFNNISESEYVINIFIKYPLNNNELVDAIEKIDADDLESNSIYSGDGIVVGILESGLVDPDSENFSNIDVFVFNQNNANNYSEHATNVATCVTSVSPSVTILSSNIYGNINEEINWMLQNDVNIINMSYGDSDLHGYYNSTSAYCDYMVRMNWISFTGSAGNNGYTSGLVTNPNGFNTLTVGACNLYDNVCGFSSYVENYNINFPNLVAPGISLIIPGSNELQNGTSFSSPLVAGAAAVLMGLDPMLMFCPEHILTILMCTTYIMSDYYRPNGFDDKVGTGLLNVCNAIFSIDKYYSIIVATNEFDDSIFELELDLNAGDNIRICFASLVNNGNYTDTNIVTDYDLFIYNSNGGLRARSTTDYNNEYINYSVPVSGIYTIKIKQIDGKLTNQTDYCSLCFFVE